MIGGGKAYYKGGTLKESDAMKRAGLNPVEFVEKEDIVLINGIQVITLIMALVVYDAVNLMKCAEIISAMTVEALKEMTDAYSLFYKQSKTTCKTGKIRGKLLWEYILFT